MEACEKEKRGGGKRGFNKVERKSCNKTETSESYLHIGHSHRAPMRERISHRGPDIQ